MTIIKAIDYMLDEFYIYELHINLKIRKEGKEGGRGTPLDEAFGVGLRRD